MRKRCFCAALALCACAGLFASGSDAVIVNSAVSCFKLPEGTVLTGKQALAKFEEAARKGNAQAQAYLGFFYLRGTGVAANAGKAFSLFRQSSGKNDVLGDFGYGWCLYNGVGTAAAPAKAIVYLQNAANAGNSDAMLLLSDAYRNGKGVKADPAAALGLLRRAAAAGNASALLEMGKAYAAGVLVDRNAVEAVRFFTAAANAGSNNAKVELARCCLSGSGVDQDADEAKKYLDAAAAANNVNALILYSELYAAGNGVEKSDAMALEYLERAVRIDPAKGNLALAHYFSDKDDAKMVRYLQKAVNAKSVDAMIELGNHYLADKRVTDGVNLLRRAASLGSAAAKLQVGRYYLSQRSPRQKDQAFAFLKGAADAGLSEAWYFLAVCYRNGYGVKFNNELAADAASRAAATGNSFGQLLYGSYFRDGVGVRQDLDKAAEYFQLAADQGNAHAKSALGELAYIRSSAAAAPVAPESMRLIEESAASGDANSKYLLGKMYTNGENVARNYDEGRKYLEEAAKANHPGALCLLGVYHARGLAGERSIAKMVDCFRKADRLGSAEGSLQLGRCFFEGIGVKKNPALQPCICPRLGRGGFLDGYLQTQRIRNQA